MKCLQNMLQKKCIPVSDSNTNLILLFNGSRKPIIILYSTPYVVRDARRRQPLRHVSYVSVHIDNKYLERNYGVLF